jgi:hypothetical protein
VFGVPGGELGGSGPLVVFAEVGEHGDDPVPDPGGLSGADQDSSMVQLSLPPLMPARIKS